MHSPSSDAFSAAQPDAAATSTKTNGVHKAPPKKPGTAFDLCSDETRASLMDKAKDDDEATVEEELTRRWKDLSDTQRDEYQTRADRRMAEYEKEKDAYDAKAKKEEGSGGEKAEADNDGANAEATESEQPAPARTSGDDEQTPQQQQEDVEMTNYDTDQETQGEKPEE